jgi:hypothetical protein
VGEGEISRMAVVSTDVIYSLGGLRRERRIGFSKEGR